ncbi:hypothetical protein MKD41_01595 [Lutibacter sp. A64]|uniref:BfmA/BtgA family mobilization protein n=1 Tax=Lutibacter sp. A64 TaxID=2918526 RepID=UPI001F055862|nr:BfmA/BtgA family mobilization protein [Lutibacter sp. A64]UMB54184.1 hypothetical protein MKD41_01595 [Lutibacter sp. A64]
MDTFSTIRFKIKVANKFRKFSIQIARTHSEAMEAMLNFFDLNDLSPNDNLGVKNERTNKRINAVIAILKNIEKHQTKPTTAMLKKLFEEVTNEENEEEEYDFETPKLTTETEELTYFRNAYYTKQENYNVLKQDIEDIIRKTIYIKSSFGKGYFKLNITKEELENLKLRLENVYHNNSTEIGS